MNLSISFKYLLLLSYRMSKKLKIFVITGVIIVALIVGIVLYVKSRGNSGGYYGP